MPAVMPLVARELRTESRSTSRFAGRRVHFIGIGGCGMSGLARMLVDAGAIVTGSDKSLNDQTSDLARRGVVIDGNQDGHLVTEEVDLVVRTAAVPDNNLEFMSARKRGIETIKYAELLGQVMAERRGIAVAGTHGKSTTTAMIAFALAECGADPSFVVGGTVPQLGGTGSRSGASDLFVAEACEYDRSFHALRPKTVILLNIEEDHLDCYKNLDDIVQSFHDFAALVPKDGLIIAHGDDANVAKALQGIAARVETVSLVPGATWTCCPNGVDVDGLPHGAVWRNGEPVGMMKLSVAGEHNLSNATMALAACVASGVKPEKALAALQKFTGVDRRMTHVGEYNGATVVDDYGHHPTEIRATLAALRERYRPNRLICVFQPHQHSRTRFLLEDFATSFAAADETIVPDIYFVRDSEEERHAVSANDLVERIRRNGQRALHLPAFEQIVEHLRREARAGDLIVTMGAGNVWEIGRELVG
jgi:UDP-N-acetylmuramate--alanine ligase